MANQQNRQKKTSGGIKCPQCGERPLARKADGTFEKFCSVCRPDYRIDAELTRGDKGWQIIVQTYKNDTQHRVSFIVQVSGKNLAIVRNDQKKYWKDDGVAVIPLDFSSKERKATFHIIGGPADIHTLPIPKEKLKRFESIDPDPAEGFWANLLRGFKGER